VAAQGNNGAGFDFGRNWEAFSRSVGDAALNEARKGLQRLFPDGALEGVRLLDIGCGSGLHSVAALTLGVRSLVAIDINPRSVSTTHSLMERFAPPGNWLVQQASVFNLPPDQFDIVYSWGVLHHTGDMRRALDYAIAQVRPGGLFAFALYRRTPLCSLWKLEKRLYTASGTGFRRFLEAGYKFAFRCGLALTGRSYADYVRDYIASRGMSFETDVRDWLGGYPYESISEAEVEDFMIQRGFTKVRSFCHKPGFGLLGTGCDEYVYRRGIHDFGI